VLFPFRTYKLREVLHNHETFGRIEAFLQEVIEFTIAGVHHPYIVTACYFTHPIFKIAPAFFFSEIIVTNARRVHFLRQHCKFEGSRPCLLYFIVREGKFEIGR